MLNAVSTAAAAELAGLWLSLEHTAKRCNRTERTIKNWMNTPELGFPRPRIFRRRHYFSVDELTQWQNRFSDKFKSRGGHADAL